MEEKTSLITKTAKQAGWILSVEVSKVDSIVGFDDISVEFKIESNN